MYDWVHTGHQKAKMEQVAECPSCGKKEETLEHMFQFKQPQMKNLRGECIDVMRKILRGISFP